MAVLRNRYDIITPQPIVRLLRNLTVRCKMTCRRLHTGQYQDGDPLRCSLLRWAPDCMTEWQTVVADLIAAAHLFWQINQQISESVGLGAYARFALISAHINYWQLGAQKIEAPRGWCLRREFPSPQPTRGSGRALWTPPAGSGAEPRPPTHFWHIWRPQNTFGRENSVTLTSFFPVKIHLIDDWGPWLPCPPPPPPLATPQSAV